MLARIFRTRETHPRVIIQVSREESQDRDAGLGRRGLESLAGALRDIPYSSTFPGDAHSQRAYTKGGSTVTRALALLIHCFKGSRSLPGMDVADLGGTGTRRRNRRARLSPIELAGTATFHREAAAFEGRNCQGQLLQGRPADPNAMSAAVQNAVPSRVETASRCPRPQVKTLRRPAGAAARRKERGANSPRHQKKSSHPCRGRLGASLCGAASHREDRSTFTR